MAARLGQSAHLLSNLACQPVIGQLQKHCAGEHNVERAVGIGKIKHILTMHVGITKVLPRNRHPVFDHIDKMQPVAGKPA